MSNPWQKSNQPDASKPANLPPWMKTNANKPPAQNAPPASNQPWNKPNTQQPPPPPPEPAKPPVQNNSPSHPNASGGKAMPPWMQNKQPTSGPPVTSPPPMNKPQGASQPWMKNQSSPNTSKLQEKSQQIPQSEASPENQPNTGGSMPPWMKNKPAGSTPNPPANKQGATPPWIKNKENGSANTSKIESQISQIPLQQQKQEKVDIIVSEYEGKKNQNQQIKQIIQQNQPIQPETVAKKQTKKTPIKQKKSPQKKKKPPLTTNSPFHKYLSLLEGCFDVQNFQYQQRIQNQQNFVKLLTEFATDNKQALKTYMKNRKITQRKNNFLLLNNDTIFCKYALIFTKTNQELQQSLFKQEQMEQLQMTYLLYKHIFVIINRIIKKNLGKKFRLRVPMLAYVQYKGMEFMCESICDELTDVINSPAQSYPQVQIQMNILQKQLKQHFGAHELINRKNFSLKKIVIKEQSQQKQYYIIYLNDNPIQLRGLSNQTCQYFLNPNLNTENTLLNSKNALSPLFLSDLQYFATNVEHINYVDFYIISKYFKKNQEMVAQKLRKEFDNMMTVFQLAHTVKVIYGSCQGELEEQTFWQLVFEGNEGVWNLIKKSYNNKSQVMQNNKIKVFLMAEFLQRMLAIKFNRKYLKKLKPMNPISDLDARSHLYPLNNFQLFQICQLFNKYTNDPSSLSAPISQESDTYKLIQKSLQHQKKMKQIGGSHYFSDYILIRNQVIFLINTEQYGKAIDILSKQVKNQKDKGSVYRKLGFDLLLITCYMFAQGKRIKRNEEEKQERKLNQENQNIEIQNKELQGNSIQKKQLSQIKEETDQELQLLKKFSDLLQNISKLFATQQQIWYHSNIYLIVASYYCKKIVNNNKSTRKLNESASIQSQLFSGAQLLKQLQKDIDPQKQRAIIQETNLRYFQTGLKFINHALNLTVQIYGNMSVESARILHEKANLYYIMGQYAEAENILEKAINIYKISSKSYKYGLECLYLKGRIQMENQKLEGGVEMLENVGKQFIENGAIYDAISVYEYLYANGPRPFGYSLISSNPQKYLQKQFELCLLHKIPTIFKQLSLRLIAAQMKFHNPQKIKILKKVFETVLKQKEDNEHLNSDEVIFQIEEYYRGYGNCIQMIRMSLLGVLNNKNVDSVEYQKAEAIVQLVLNLLSEEQFDKSIEY